MTLTRFDKQFLENTVLKAQDLRDIVDKINYIIDNLNIHFQGGTETLQEELNNTGHHDDWTPENPDDAPVNPDNGGQSNNNSLYSATCSVVIHQYDNMNRFTVTLNNAAHTALTGKQVTLTAYSSFTDSAYVSTSNIFIHTFPAIDPIINVEMYGRDISSKYYKFRIQLTELGIDFYTDSCFVTGTGGSQTSDTTPQGDNTGNNGDTGNTGEQDNTGTVPDHSDPNTGVPEPADPLDPTQPEQQVQ